MRKIDENKKIAIRQAVFELNEQAGLAGLSMGKVAKVAGVSPATLYIYYADKSDMLGQILMEVKDLMDEGQEVAILAASDPIEQVKNFLHYFVNQCEKHPQEALFMQAALENPTEISNQALAYSAQKAEPLQRLYERLIASGKVKNYPPELIVAFTTTPFTDRMTEKFRAGEKLTKLEIERMVEMAVDAILIH